MTATPQDRRVVLYDGDCAFCKWSLNRILAWDRGGVVRPVAIQSPEGAALLAAVPEQRRLDSWHLVEPSGRLLSGGRAAAPLFAVLPAGRPLAALLRAFPELTEGTYRWVAEHRGQLSRVLRIDPSCELRRRG
jgi:predicted DCC family thiol-disulfide oxidoreductase YuxK